MELPSLVASVLIKGLDLWITPVFRFGFRNGSPFVELFPKDSPHETIDARLAKIEVARRNLAEGLEAIDELKSAAESNQAQLAIALERLCDVQDQRASAEKEVQAVQSIAQADVEVFRKLAGVPSKMEIARERLIASSWACLRQSSRQPFGGLSQSTGLLSNSRIQAHIRSSICCP